MANNILDTLTTTMQVRARGYEAAAHKAIASLDMDGRGLAYAPDTLTSEGTKKSVRAFYIVPENGAYPEEMIIVSRVANGSYACEVRPNYSMTANPEGNEPASPEPAEEYNPSSSVSKSDAVCNTVNNTDDMIIGWFAGLYTDDEMYTAIDVMKTMTDHKVDSHIDSWKYCQWNMAWAMTDYQNWLDSGPYGDTIELPTLKPAFRDYLRSLIIRDEETGYSEFFVNMYMTVSPEAAYAHVRELVTEASSFDHTGDLERLIAFEGVENTPIPVSILQVYNTAVDETLSELMGHNNECLNFVLQTAIDNNAA